jgi:peptide chain release factor 3
MPIFTFVNKCDRVGEDPLKLVSDVEADLDIACHPITWPIHRDGVFVGVYDRRRMLIHLFERADDHGASRAGVQVGSLRDAALRDVLGEASHERLVQDIALLDEAGHPFDESAVLAGDLSPVFFGSALTNFGVEPFLREFLELAPEPSPRESTAGLVQPTDEQFTGFVFKIQANMDAKHRDRVAFARVCSGKFQAGMQVVQTRTAKPIRLAAAQQFLARERQAVESAWPGDVIGIMDRGGLRIGDTLAEPGEPIEFQGIPRFAPEHFARIIIKDPMKRKQLDTGLRQLTEEGAAQVFFTSGTDTTSPTPIVGAVGMLQFDVMLHRLEHEYGAPCRLERITARYPRWVTGPMDEIERLSRDRGRMLLFDSRGQPMILFEDAFGLRWALERESDGPVSFHEVAP